MAPPKLTKKDVEFQADIGKRLLAHERAQVVSFWREYVTLSDGKKFGGHWHDLVPLIDQYGKAGGYAEYLILEEQVMAQIAKLHEVAGLPQTKPAISRTRIRAVAPATASARSATRKASK
jgi:hypothetical protein